MGRTHPDTLMTIWDTAHHKKGLMDFAKAEEMYRLALEGCEKSLGKDAMFTKECVQNLARLLERIGRQTDLQKVLNEYLYIEDDSD